MENCHPGKGHEAWDEVGRLCEGTHERFLIDPGRFAEKMAGAAVR